jgi:Fusaric acid resistance protein family
MASGARRAGAAVPAEALLKSLIYGPTIASLFYFEIMPTLTDMWQLAPFLVLALFPCGYFVNSPNPGTSIAAMMSAIWVLQLIDLSQGQVYDFAGFTENLLGIVGAVIVAITAVSLVDAPIPERRFRDQVRGFFATCEQVARAMAVLEPGAPAETRLRAGKSRQMEQLRMGHMWWAQLDHERFSEDERHKALRLMAAMRALAFRQDALEHARLALSAVGSLQALAEPAAELRARARRVYGILEEAAARCERAAALPAISELAAPYQAWLDMLSSVPASEPDAKELRREVLVLIGLHLALVYAIHDCHDRFNALDWRLWGRAHF